MIKPYQKDDDTAYVEGFFPAIQLLETRKDKLVSLYVSENALESDAYGKIEELVPKDKIIVSDKAFRIIKAKENSHVIAVFRKYQSELEPDKDHVVMVNPQDSGNLGNAMRTLLAFGYKNLAIIEPANDYFSPKTLRSSMGAFFHINVESFDSFESYAAKYQRKIYPFMLNGKNELSDVSFDSPCSFVFGNEATGLPPSFMSDDSVRIRQSDDVDSLNLTTSIAIALYTASMKK